MVGWIEAMARQWGWVQQKEATAMGVAASQGPVAWYDIFSITHCWYQPKFTDPYFEFPKSHFARIISAHFDPLNPP